MKADPRFLRQPKEFWANVRTISQAVGYTRRAREGSGEILVATIEQVREKFAALKLSTSRIANDQNDLTDFGRVLFSYFAHRANVINDVVRPLLMNRDGAKAEFERLCKAHSPRCPLPMNKQKGEKKGHAFLTGIVNVLIEANIGGLPLNYDPKGLTTVTHDAMPLRTLSRRVDGAFPSIVNPLAIWEIKEYYYTTTFGSRVADGVYETLVDGMELEELNNACGREIYHILFIDDYFTWWVKGRSYLCRLIDLLHMGFVDEVVVGREVLDRVPELAREWRAQYEQFAATIKEPVANVDVTDGE
ncbi:MAG: DUF7687 domain-containing protein [Terracidiphilus sp.]